MSSIQEAVNELFKIYDKDNSGQLDCTQLGKIIRDCYKQMGNTRQISDTDVKNVLKAMDRNNDGQISKQELVEILNKLG